MLKTKLQGINPFISFQTPKRPCTDMLFLPEQCEGIQTAAEDILQSYLKEILVQKFNQHLKLVQDNITDLQKKAKELRELHAKDITSLKMRLIGYNSKLEDLRASRGENIRFFNVAEENSEDLIQSACDHIAF